LARIKVIVRGTNVYQYKGQLRVSDMNYGNHLGNDKVLSLFHECRLSWMKTINYDELNFYGKALIQHDALINYKSEGLYGDLFNIKLYIDDIDSKSFDFYYQIINITSDQDMAIGKTGMTFYDYDLQKITDAPIPFIEKFRV
jgi:acyl-CoA thioester hydrolase